MPIVGDRRASSSGTPILFSSALLACAVPAMLAVPLRATASGYVRAWGANDSGQTSLPASLIGPPGSATAIEVGNQVGCALQPTGHMICWPQGFIAESPLGPDPFIAFDVGPSHLCGIRGTGEAGPVACFSPSNLFGEATVPASVNGDAGSSAWARAVSSGAEHVCAIRRLNGAVVCWGRNDQFQATPPPAVNGLVGTAIAVAGGVEHSCAIQAGTGAVVVDAIVALRILAQGERRVAGGVADDEAVVGEAVAVIDWDGAPPDPQCVGKPWRNREATGCGLGAELALLVPMLAWLRRKHR